LQTQKLYDKMMKALQLQSLNNNTLKTMKCNALTTRTDLKYVRLWRTLKSYQSFERSRKI